MQTVDERAEDLKRLVTLAAAMCETIRDWSAAGDREETLTDRDE